MDITISGAVLAGGKAQRFGGKAKGLLEAAPGKTLVAQIMDAMAASGLADIVISANDPAPYRPFGLPVIPDLRLGLGPLAGIEAVLCHFAETAAGVLFLPCDLPGIGAAEISLLLTAFRQGPRKIKMAVTGSGQFRRHVLCCAVPCEAREAVSRSLDEKRLGVERLWEKLGAETVRFEDPDPFFNVNTPQDYARWKGESERRS